MIFRRTNRWRKVGQTSSPSPQPKQYGHYAGYSQTKEPVVFCIVFSVIALLGVISGFLFRNGLIMMIALLPAAIYLAIRTAGVFTKFASIALVICLIADIILIIMGIKFNVAQYLGTSSEYIGGYIVPLGDIKSVLLLFIVIFALILLIRTAGKYTKWLSVIIIVASFSMLYILSPKDFPEMLKWGIRQISRMIWYVF